MKYKMVLVDLDRTLLKDDKTVDDYDVQVLQKLIDSGIVVTIATGRRYYSAKHLSDIIDRPLVILANNGNVVRENREDNVLDCRTLDYEVVVNIVNSGISKGLVPLFHVNGYEKGYDLIIIGGLGEEAIKPYLKGFGNRYKTIKGIDELKEEDVLALVYIGNPKELEDYEKFVIGKYSPLNTHVVTNFVNFSGMLEIMNFEGSKWDAGLRVSQKINIKPEEIISIGDDLNDLFMVKNAGLGIAMKNAIDPIKNIADIITEYDNNENGVGRVLSDIFKEIL
ncbi:MAG: HAD family hydrolase [Tissierellia bacterium]|nr:HAD family hydrolase [Tissierellia bacterium]